LEGYIYVDTPRVSKSKKPRVRQDEEVVIEEEAVIEE
jgi:hypothetical protein